MESERQKRFTITDELILALLVGSEHIENRNEERHKQTMAALQNLTDAVTGLTKTVDAAVTEITTPHVNDAQAQAAADAVNAQSSRLTTAIASVNPTPPAPTPAV